MEIWKDIVGYESLYQVSNKGRIRSLDRYQINHGTPQKRLGSIKHLREKNNGYYVTDLYKNGKQKTVHIHRLVANAFLTKIAGKNTVNHINGDKSNNKVENLEWATPEEQNNHFYSHHLKSENSIKKSIKAMNEANSRKVERIEDKIVFDSMSEAARFVGKSNGVPLIARSCKSRGHYMAYGFHWKYYKGVVKE